MIRIIHYILFGSLLLFSKFVYSQDTNAVRLHLQVYDQGICLPMLLSDYYSSSKFQKTKSVFKVGSYYSTLNVYVDSPDSAHLHPQSNHQIQAGSLNLNPKKEYQLVITRTEGFFRNNLDSMVIKIANLEKDAQLIVPFQKGIFTLHKMKYYKELKENESPNFMNEESLPLKNTLKSVTTTFYSNGNKKAHYYQYYPNFPLYFVQEFDSINPHHYAQGFRFINIISAPNFDQYTTNSIWNNPYTNKYGYWEYFEGDKRLRLEFHASILQEKYEWYPSGSLKFTSLYGASYNLSKHTIYLENGAIKEEYLAQTRTENSVIKSYYYSPEGVLLLINTYKSNNGITKQGLIKRELFYPSEKLKMVEILGTQYSIKYYNEDGTERIN